MTKISDLPRELTGKILSRVPLTSIRAVRSTCKNWNTLAKDRILIERKEKGNEYQVVMMIDYRVSLMNVNLLDPCIQRIGKLISLEDVDRVDVSKIFHCNGLFLCIIIDKSNLVVWNPYLGQTKWIKPRNSYHDWDSYAIGYKKNNNLHCSHKILRFVDEYDMITKRRICEFEIFNLDSNSWKVVDDATPDWRVDYNHRGVSLEGNTYWSAHKKLINPSTIIDDLSDFLISFNFTTEKFGPHLSLPFHSSFVDVVTLSAVREKQLAVLFQKHGVPTFPVKIWISTKIEPNAVLWGDLFLKVDMEPHISSDFNCWASSFFVDEEKQVVVVIDKERCIIDINYGYLRNRNGVAYFIGKNGYIKKMELSESQHPLCFPLVCHYVPSLVQI